MGEAEKNGVFLHSKNLDSEFMIKCLQMLVNDFPEIQITSVVSDELHFGYRVYFSSPAEDAVLAKKHLVVSGENIRIGPLLTFLTIHGVRKWGSEQYEVELRETIWNTFGKLVRFVPASDLENEINKNLRACVDVPELEELEIFHHEGYPDMFLCLPSNNEMLRVTFHCRRCKNDGHVLQDCSILTPPKEKSTKKTNASIDSKKFTLGVANPFPIKKSPHAWAEKMGREEALKTGSLTSGAVKPFLKKLESPHAEKIGKEEILKTGILPERNQNEEGSKPGPSTTSVKMNEGNWTPEKFPFFKIETKVEEHDNPTDAKNSEDLMQDANASGNEDEISKSNVDDDDGGRVIDCHEISNSSNSRHSFTSNSEIKDDETNSREEFSSARFFQELFSSDNPSGLSPMNLTNPPKLSVENTKILSPELQACINSACEECDILDRVKLDAFLIHVKNISNPSQIAMYFTNSPWKLQALLQRIKFKFYNTPHAATKEDKQFIKWLTGLVARFEGSVPIKRKICEQNHSDPPNKK